MFAVGSTRDTNGQVARATSFPFISQVIQTPWINLATRWWCNYGDYWAPGFLGQVSDYQLLTYDGRYIAEGEKTTQAHYLPVLPFPLSDVILLTDRTHLPSAVGVPSELSMTFAART
jgi:hypothetical protein